MIQHRQKTLMGEAISKCFRANGFVGFSKLYKMLEQLLEFYEKLENQQAVDSLDTLISRFSICEHMTGIVIKLQEKTKDVRPRRSTILQLSDFPELQRDFLTEFFADLIWTETFNHPGKRSFDTIFLDEFQNMSMKKGGALSSILREGRKFGISAVLSSQFISSYNEEAQNTLFQSGNLLVFNPVAKEQKIYAEKADYNAIADWKEILKNLEVGEVVLIGNYRVNGNRHVQTRPIICRIR